MNIHKRAHGLRKGTIDELREYFEDGTLSDYEWYMGYSQHDDSIMVIVIKDIVCGSIAYDEILVSIQREYIGRRMKYFYRNGKVPYHPHIYSDTIACHGEWKNRLKETRDADVFAVYLKLFLSNRNNNSLVYRIEYCADRLLRYFPFMKAIPEKILSKTEDINRNSSLVSRLLIDNMFISLVKNIIGRQNNNIIEPLQKLVFKYTMKNTTSRKIFLIQSKELILNDIGIDIDSMYLKWLTLAVLKALNKEERRFLLSIAKDKLDRYNLDKYAMIMKSIIYKINFSQEVIDTNKMTLLELGKLLDTKVFVIKERHKKELDMIHEENQVVFNLIKEIT